jgi:hypothetical protein
MEKTAADILEEAADLIEQGRHLRGALTDYKDGYCANGAIMKAATGQPFYTSSPRGLFATDFMLQVPCFDKATTAAIAAVVEHLDLEPVSPLEFSAWELHEKDIPLINRIAEALVQWNNNRDRTGAEVVDAFRHAAKNLRNQNESTVAQAVQRVADRHGRE